jgi:hypothetical protein
MQGFDAGGASSGASGTHAKGVPFFWLNVLCNQDMLAEHITARDKLALEYLQVRRGGDLAQAADCAADCAAD